MYSESMVLVKKVKVLKMKDAKDPDEFLKRFDISAITELPKYEDLMSQIEKIRETYSDSLFNRFEPVTPAEDELDKKLEEINKSTVSKTDDEL